MKKLFKKQWIVFAFVVGVALIIAAGTVITLKTKKSQKEAEVISVSTLERIINVSELSTFTAVYNGIAQVMNEEKADKIVYYVSYEAKVNAGIDFEKIDITLDNDTKTIYLTIPEVYITEANVDIASLDYIFMNNKANTSSVSNEAFKACEADVKAESEQQKAIFELATQNAKNILTALVRPIVEQSDEDYVLVIE